jgi:hypothetical protein
MDTTPPAPVTSEQPLVYRPISLLAIGSLVAAGLFTAFVLVTGGVALFYGAPIYMPPWILGLAILGAILAAAAGWRIRGSEGTLAGQALANWGWWLSIISGLGYAAFYGATVLAITQQADNFLRVEAPDSGFFPLLQKGKVEEAFLLTQPPARRATANLQDAKKMELQFDLPGGKGAKGLLSMFRGNDLIRMLADLGDRAQVKPLGVKEWVYGNKGFTVKRAYRINTPEVELDVLLPVMSSEGDESGPGRNWFVMFFPSPSKVAMQLTPLGEMMTAYRQQARSIIKGWADKINLNHPDVRRLSYYDTLQPESRDKTKRLEAVCTAMRLLGEPFAYFGQSRGACLPLISPGPLFHWQDFDSWLYVPGYADFVAGKFIDRTDWDKIAPDPDLRKRIRTQVMDSFYGRNHPGRPPIVLRGSEESYTPYRKKDGKIQILANYEMPVGMTAQDPMPKNVAEVTVTAEAREVGSKQEVESILPGEWRIVSVEITHLRQMPSGLLKLDPSQLPPDPGSPLR